MIDRSGYISSRVPVALSSPHLGRYFVIGLGFTIVIALAMGGF